MVKQYEQHIRKDSQLTDGQKVNRVTELGLIVQLTIAGAVAGLRPYQASGVNDATKDNRTRNQGKQTYHHQC